MPNAYSPYAGPLGNSAALAKLPQAPMGPGSAYPQAPAQSPGPGMPPGFLQPAFSLIPPSYGAAAMPYQQWAPQEPSLARDFYGPSLAPDGSTPPPPGWSTPPTKQRPVAAVPGLSAASQGPAGAFLSDRRAKNATRDDAVADALLGALRSIYA